MAEPTKPEILISLNYDKQLGNYKRRCMVYDDGELKKVSENDYDSDQQPEIARWPPKPEILTYL